ncbi:hypothetical protein BV22DRAFT_1072345 [Leucogyrophana mollusca]|uniref:Uncharacterized protein n=1 Tax=Leucogyrophana mollusca TaxID=85980 RepID=A0ACB8B892_9AGAM|nr:hypothetical protein BV22DRAFT_1072345 [Leucogyrophana mollusca]
MGFNIHLVRKVAAVVHGVAISSTVFRLSYRWYRLRFWWEDGWASVALLFDVVCVICTWIQVPVASKSAFLVNNAANWVVAVSFTSVVWAARLSVLFSIVRVANPAPRIRWFAVCVAIAFGVMWLGIVGIKLYVCDRHRCLMRSELAISQLTSGSISVIRLKYLSQVLLVIADAISDTVLVALPFLLLRGVKVSRNARILISCALSASLLITAITILQSTLLCIHAPPLTTTIVAHVQAALSLMVCNLLVIATCVYRVYRKSGSADLDHSFSGSEAVELTTIVLTQFTGQSNDEGGNIGTAADPATSQVASHRS